MSEGLKTIKIRIDCVHAQPMPYNLHNLSQPAAMRNIRYSWVSLGHFAVNLSGGQPKMY